MEARFARYKTIAPGTARGLEEFPAAAAGDCDRANGHLSLSDDAHPGHVEKIFHSRGNTYQRRGAFWKTKSARAHRLVRFIRHQRPDVGQANPFRQTLIDTAARRIKRRVWAIDGHSRGDE